MMRRIILCAALVLSVEVQAQDRFEQAVAIIKQAEGMHTARHHPYVGYGHRLQAGERFPATMSERQADALLRSDLRQKCRIFRSFGRDSLLLGVLAYNVGEYRLLGNGEHPKSRLIRKLEAGDRDIYAEYVTFRKYKGKVLPSLERRRKTEFQILYEK